MKLSSEERDFVKKIASIAGGIDTAVVREVFSSLLVSTAFRLYSGENYIYIPYLGKLEIDYKKIPDLEKGIELKEVYTLTTSKHLHDVMVKIASDEHLNLEKFIKKEIAQSAATILDIQDMVEFE